MAEEPALLGRRGDAVAVEVAAGDLASTALRLATVNPAEAQALSVRAEQHALARRDWAAVSVARRAAGVADLQLRHHDTAVPKLRAAETAALKAGSPQLAGEANMSLASALALRGDPQQGFAAIETALQQLSGAAWARALTQRAAILQELGRVDQALEDLRRALPSLRQAGDVQWETRALSNRSLLLVARRRFGAAKADLDRAKALCDTHGLTLPGAYVEQNLGCLFADRGDVPEALQHFDSAAARYQQMGMQVGSLLVDRAKLLLSVRLVDEARTAAEAAVRVFGAQGRHLALPEAQLIVSTAALHQDDRQTAVSAARSAARSFARLNRTEWAALARYSQLQAQLEPAVTTTESAAVAGRPRRTAVTPAKLRAAATELEHAGWVVPALEAQLLAGRLALHRGQQAAAREDFAAAARARRSGPADARARAWLAVALLREAEGSRRSAKLALHAGLRVLEQHQASMGATELRAHVLVHQGALVRAGLRMALQDGDAKGVHAWGERGRAFANQRRPVRPPTDSVLARELQDLRTTVAEIEHARGTGTSTTDLVARQVMLEGRIRDHVRLLQGTFGPVGSRAASVDELAGRLGSAALLEFVDLDETLRAVTLVDGRLRLHELGPVEPIRRSLRFLPFALHRLAYPAARAEQLTSAAGQLQHIALTLDQILLQPMRQALGDRELVVAPAGWLEAVPWSVLPTCAGRPVSVTPSAALWLAAWEREPGAGAGVVSIAGPGLPGAQAEARSVAALYPGASLLDGPQATVSAVGQAMERSRLAHVAAHGLLRSDNPLFSSLQLADGPFTVYDMEALARTPHHVVLAACSTGALRVTAGAEVMGLAAALLGGHTATLVSPVVPVSDADSTALMTSYHRLLRRGKPAAVALAAAQQMHRDDSPAARAAAAAFICLGASRPDPVT
ncbi:MAG: CHAT domain-containing protein [Dermatophilaceae bacterium]